ncbi:hypothetical protein [Caldanaerobacter subterraneus]|uniref:Uncharacterized protein n=1 Tax=Caldanaerobacter subterraneus TaxID=911092 RepID=A0A7Y2L9E6_9THEO|nr:hypothetical protein [Caldanaerobacter subterraneus]NNG67627.1 hypothetical protein [Caldanaerobacter subterraneus]
MNRKTGIIFILLGIFIFLAGFSLRNFIYQEEFILKNDLNRRFLSSLYDNKLLDPGISMGNIYYYSDYFKEKRELKLEVLHVLNFKNKKDVQVIVMFTTWKSKSLGKIIRLASCI